MIKNYSGNTQKGRKNALNNTQLQKWNDKTKTGYRRKKTLPVFRLFFIVAVGIFCLFLLTNKQILKTAGVPGMGLPKVNATEPSVDLTGIYSESVFLEEFFTGQHIAEKNSRKKIYPASLTKIMTAVLVLEHMEEIPDIITVPERIFPGLYAENASMAGFRPGEKVRRQDLLYGILLPSGAECCLTYAVEISGSEENFVDLMNQKAKELGMNNTHFCNSTGLHHKNHYSTAEDIAVLLRYALQNEDFRKAFTTRSYTTAATREHPEGLTFYNTMFQCMDTNEVNGGKIIGGKTGFTDEAGLCLASLAEINGKEYILVTAGAEGNHQTEPFHILDARKIYNCLQ